MRTRLIFVLSLALVVPIVASGCVMGPCGGFDWSPPHVRDREEIDRAELGPVPDMSKARLVAKAHILAQHHDPSSIKIVWPAEFRREKELLSDDAPGPAQVSWNLTVTVAGPDESTNEERETTSVFSYRLGALVRIVERSGDKRYTPPVPIEDLAAKALESGYALEPDELPTLPAN